MLIGLLLAVSVPALGAALAIATGRRSAPWAVGGAVAAALLLAAYQRWAAARALARVAASAPPPGLDVYDLYAVHEPPAAQAARLAVQLGLAVAAGAAVLAAARRLA